MRGADAVAQSKSRAYIRGGEKQNRQWTARFRLESYQSLSGHNPTSALAALRAGGYRRVLPPSLPFVVPGWSQWGSIDTPSIPDGVLTRSRRRERLYCRHVCLIRARYAAKMERDSARLSERIAAGDRGIEDGLERFCNHPSRAAAQSRRLNGDRLVFTPVINVRTLSACAQYRRLFAGFNAQCNLIADFRDS